MRYILTILLLGSIPTSPKEETPKPKCRGYTVIDSNHVDWCGKTIKYEWRLKRKPRK